MGRRGPKPKPTTLKIIEGERRPSRLGRRGPAPDLGRPEPPDWLDDDERAEFVRLAEVLHPAGLATALDSTALAILASVSTRYSWARREVQEKGYLVERSRGGGHTKSPALRVLEATEPMLIKLMERFGMSPAARAGMRLDPPEEGDPLGEFLHERGHE